MKKRVCLMKKSASVSGYCQKTRCLSFDRVEYETHLKHKAWFRSQDEKHTAINGRKAYLATTVGDDCVLGASISLTAAEAGLTEACGHFKAKARACDPDYQPRTVNTDGWAAAINSWKNLFPTIVTLLCFLHGFLRQIQHQSPFHKLNGFVYHDNWLHNLLIATSCAGGPG
jgi:hypothetical protein